MSRSLESTWKLTDTPLSQEEFVRAFQDFEFFMSHCQQIINKRRQLVPMTLNPYQKEVFKILFPMVDPRTRENKAKSIILLKGRRVGASTGLIAFINYILSFAEGLENLNVLHLFPVSDAATKIYSSKVKDIITGVHPDMMPTISKVSGISSIVLNYESILGVERHNSYEIASAGTSSLRGSDFHVAILDECFSPNVEILTDKGFKRFDELDRTEKVAQFNCEGETISFVKPLRYIDRPYNGDAYEWEVNGDKFYSTMNHAFVAGRRHTNWRSTRTKYKRVMAYEPFVNSNYDVPVWGTGISEDMPLTPLERLGIATQADGSVYGVARRKGKTVRAVGDTMCRMSLRKSTKITRMRRLLKEANIPYSEYNCGRDGYVGFSYTLPFRDPKHLDTFLSVECSYSRAREIIHEVLMWDGYGLNRDVMYGQPYVPHNSYYSSTEKRNRDFVAAVALQGRIKVHCGAEEDKRSEKHRTMYRLNMTSNGLRTYGSFKRTEANYEGRVYCVEVPLGCIVVRVGKEVFVTGNCASYKRPYDVEAVVEPMMPEEGFSLSIFASTFDDGVSQFYREKILQARAHPDEWDIIFVPWFVSYPECPTEVPLESIELTEYDQNVIIPAMIEYGFPQGQWGASIKWYHQKSAKMSSANMHKEFPTTIEEVLAIGRNEGCFTPESLDKQEDNIMPNKAYRLVTDAITNKSELHADEDGPFMIYRPPISGHRYLLCCDPISSNSGESDYFAAGVFDLERNSEVATLYIRGLPVEDLAELTAGLAQIYNRAMILPESNFGQALVACIRAKGYYNFYYTDKRAKAKKEPGIRTSVSTKPKMIDRLQLMLDGGRITIYSEETLRQLRKYEKIVKDRSGGGSSVSFSAPRGDHDDMIIPLLLFAGSRSDRELSGKKGQGFAIL